MSAWMEFSNEVGEIAPNPKRRKTNHGHKVHSSKAYNMGHRGMNI
jgi:hypothetical protein